ncbi:GNAT family N-acetyltransferase [Bradyrhizobium sp. Gha]|uniref:GNAT family N-acetyltransferase n=1 Tax=Bradyrhizobium sp. Gha TaxID=1855318 RepID=UPI0008DFFC05|nr:GNAT family N-acetyltransferase [Bradyrhizobium sp. Gha]SFI82745.1 Acetyltransferase (GNAT) family protein [Bradyrhizobium sp. Gha]
MQYDKFNIQELEERGFNAWPARHTTHVNGWLIRVGGGLTKRTNSANCLAPFGSFANVKSAAELIFKRQALPTIFRITPLVPQGIDRLLEQDGYTIEDACVVLAATQDAFRTGSSSNIKLRATPGEEWRDGVASASAIPAHLRAVHDKLVDSIQLPAVFATAYVEDAAAGYAMAVFDRDMIGIFDAVVNQSHRGKGIWQALMAKLLQWGKQQGATAAYFQATETNEIIRKLGLKLGFREIYHYHYRCRL